MAGITGKDSGRALNLYKRLGETPRERLERLRKEKPQYAHEVLSYAGRLDPMAEGVLICLVGAENKKRDSYLDLSKEYVLDVLFGFSTDSYDVLGKVRDAAEPVGLKIEDIRQALNEFRGKVPQTYPPFSSKPVDGSPLWSWARGGAIEALLLPQRTVTVYQIDIEKTYKVKEADLLSYIETSVGKVQGDFRQEETLRLWNQNLMKEGKREFPCVSIRVACSSGTYMRSIANRLGEELELPALALHILRTKVGEFTAEKSLK